MFSLIMIYKCLMSLIITKKSNYEIPKEYVLLEIFYNKLKGVLR